MTPVKNKVLRRLITVLAALEAHPGGLSALELENITGYPAGLILDDLNNILYYTEMAGHFTLYSEEDGGPAGEAPEGEEPPGENDDHRVGSTRSKWFLTGRSGPYPALNLTLREAAALLWLFEEYPPPKQLQEFCGNLLAGLMTGEEIAAAKELAGKLQCRGGVTLTDDRFLDQLRDAVLGEYKVRVVYYARNLDREVDWLLHPLGLVYHTGNGVWYLVARLEDTGETVVCHLNRMRRVVPLKEKYDYPCDFSLHGYLKKRWGMDMSPPETVRVRFYNEAGVVEKALKEFEDRGLPRPVALPGGALEYHGEILGVNNFAKWVLTFGSSAEVLEPAWLREKVIETALMWRHIYGRGDPQKRCPGKIYTDGE